MHRAHLRSVEDQLRAADTHLRTLRGHLPSGSTLVVWLAIMGLLLFLATS